MSARALIKASALFVGRQTVGRLPRPASRLTGRLAVEGGRPVRDIRLRPWPESDPGRRWQWWTGAGAALREVYLSGEEGLPQSRQKAFAERWAAHCGCRFGLMLPHGTDALRIGLAAALEHDGLDHGGEVIVPNLSFVASATAPLERRFGIALVDVDDGTLNLDPASVEAAIVPGRTRAIIPVHQFGQPADMSALRRIAERHGLRLVEDAAQAHGAAWEGRPAGSLGDVAAFSFQSAKNLACGEGGMLTTNDEALFRRAYALHNVGRPYGEEARWEHATLGWNNRATEYQAALLQHRYERFEQRQAVRAANFARLGRLLASSACLRPLAVHPSVTRHGLYMFVMRYDASRCGGRPIEAVLAALKAEGVPIHRCYSSTIARQPAIRDLAARRPAYVRVCATPVADRAVEEIAYIGAHAFLGTPADMDDIAAAVAKVERHFAGATR